MCQRTEGATAVQRCAENLLVACARLGNVFPPAEALPPEWIELLHLIDEKTPDYSSNYRGT